MGGEVEGKKLRLFGFDLDFSPTRAEDGGGESAASSARTPVNGGEGLTGETSSKNLCDERRFRCQFCHLKFANSQALGGHQNAHRREIRLKKRRMQLEARRASISFFLQAFPLHQKACLGGSSGLRVEHEGRFFPVLDKKKL